MIRDMLEEKLKNIDGINIDRLLLELQKKLPPTKFELKMYDILTALDDVDNHEIRRLLRDDNFDELLNCKTIDLNPKINGPIKDLVTRVARRSSWSASAHHTAAPPAIASGTLSQNCQRHVRNRTSIAP